MDDSNPQLTELLGKIQFLKATHSTLSDEIQNVSTKGDKLKAANKLMASEFQIQKKKTSALMLLCSELQRKHDAHLFQPESFERNPTTMNHEKELIKEQLVRQGEEIQLYKQLNHFLKEYTLNRSKELFDSFINRQSELAAKIQSKLLELKNPGLVCRRRWTTLRDENQQLSNRNKTLKQQLLRQQSNIKDRYEDYLNKINKYNTKLVYLNNCQDQRIISEHLIEEMSLVQRERKNIEDEYNGLKQDYKNIVGEYEQSKHNKKAIMDFFSNADQQTKLANSMKLRIGQLNDLVCDLKLYSNNPKIVIASSVVESIKDHHKKLRDKLEFLKMRYEETIDGKASIEEVEVANFFNKLFVDKDEKMNYRAKLNQQLTEKVQNLINAKTILEQKCKIIKQSIENNVVFESKFNRNTDRQTNSDLNVFTFNKGESIYF